MERYFEVKVTYQKMMPNGTYKKVSEPYLFDCLSFTEAEARATEELAPFISGEFTVKACKRTPIEEVYRDESGDRFYLAKIAFIRYDEKTRAETKAASQMLVEAGDFDRAVANVKEMMRGMLGDWELLSLAETPIMDVYPVKTENL